jgi:hypothetical protein
VAELDEAIEAAALAISVYDWHNGLSTNPEIGKPQRAEAEVAVKAAVELIEAATRRQDDAVLLDTVIGHQPGPDGCACGYDAGGHGAHVIERYQSARAAAIARGRGETQPPPTH